MFKYVSGPTPRINFTQVDQPLAFFGFFFTYFQINSFAPRAKGGVVRPYVLCAKRPLATGRYRSDIAHSLIFLR